MFQIEGKPQPTEFVSAAHFAGNTRRKIKQKKLSTTKGEAKGRYKYVSFCPECPAPPPGVSMGDPERFVHAVVSYSQKNASCKNGHSWDVR